LIQGSDSIFFAGFQDGSLLSFNKNFEDQAITIPKTESPFLFSKPARATHNPCSYWKISKKALTSLSFSPDLSHLSVTSMEGTLTILDTAKEVYH
jgi:hypothetical protein